MKRLYEDLFTDYNRLILPVTANKTKVTITLGLKLGQILDLNLKQQILSTNVWVEQTWHDHRLEWDADAYGGIDMIHVPAENIWIPDIVLFNNADGNYELTLVAKAVLYSNGTVVWKPPTMFRSTCEIDVEFFPFDIQTCFLRFGSWTYAGDEVELKHVSYKRKADIGIDLSQFYKNVEWDIIDVPAYHNENYYECCSEPYPDITFKIVIRRKMLFYLVNLILPVALMTFMTVSVFYLPADSNEKVTLSISILTSLIVFFLLMLEVIPPTSLAVPLFGKYLLFTLVLVSLSACVSVYSLNIYHRAPSVHQMSPWMRRLFLKTLPRLLRLDRPDPRERSSLNRFRKKKIAQQILQARQHHKIYDLAQPLAASLNLIETLQNSYTLNPSDDDLKLTTKKKKFEDEGEEEGRYFRRYVDNYIKNLKANEVRQDSASVISRNNSGGGSCNCDRRSQATRASCCEHKKCCSNANKPLGYLPTVVSHHPASSCCDLKCNWNAGLNPGRPSRLVAHPSLRVHSARDPSTRDHSASCTTAAQLAGLHDDTFDMTFDYDDQDNNNTNFDLLQAPGGISNIKTRLMSTETDLPTPPPPPRQLTQLSDSMKDLSGRLSSCSQQKLMTQPGHNSMKISGMNSNFENDDDDHQLVDKLINSINLISNASVEIDITTSSATPSNMDEDYQRLKALGETLNNGCHMQCNFKPSPKGWNQQGNGVQCTCRKNESDPNEAINQFSQRKPASYQQQPMMSDDRAGTNHQTGEPSQLLLSLKLPYDQMPDHVRAAIRSILFIADTIKNEDDENSAIEDWESVSMVVDRLFLWIFFLLCTFGSLIILALAPSLYDQRDSIDDKLRIEIPASNCSALHNIT